MIIKKRCICFLTYRQQRQLLIGGVRGFMFVMSASELNMSGYKTISKLPNLLAGFVAGRTPEFIEMPRVVLSHKFGSAHGKQRNRSSVSRHQPADSGRISSRDRCLGHDRWDSIGEWGMQRLLKAVEQ